MMNPFDMLKNAQGLQEHLERMQAELAAATETGSSGGGIVRVTVNGQFEMVGIELDPVAVDPRDIQMLQDLIIAAHANACEKIRELIKTRMGPLASGLNIPGLG